jgi:TolA protein
VKEKTKEKQKEKDEDEKSGKAKSEASPKPKSTPVKSEKNEKPSASPEPSLPPAAAGKNKGKQLHGQASTEPGPHLRGGGGSGPGNAEGSGSGDSALAGYVGILTNRFQAAWNQPTSEMALGKVLQVTVKLKVESDGTVTEFDIVEGSGNAVVDDSVREAGKKITKLPPPPNGQAFSAPVRFELGN